MEYTQSEYARLKGVKPPRITTLKQLGKLKMKVNKLGRNVVIDCPENDKLFKEKKNDGKA